MHLTTDPIEAEVSTALAGYRFALIRTGHNSVMHRLLCMVGDKEATDRAESLGRAEQTARAVVNKSPEHRAMLEQIVNAQPADVAAKDNLLSLLSDRKEENAHAEQ